MHIINLDTFNSPDCGNLCIYLPRVAKIIPLAEKSTTIEISNNFLAKS